MSDKITVYIGDESAAVVARLLVEREAWFEMTPLQSGRIVEVRTLAICAEALSNYTLGDDDFRQAIVRGTTGTQTPYISLEPGESTGISDNGAVLLLRYGPNGHPAVYLSRGCVAGPRLLKALHRIIRDYSKLDPEPPSWAASLLGSELKEIVEAVRDSS